MGKIHLVIYNHTFLRKAPARSETEDEFHGKFVSGNLLAAEEKVHKNIDGAGDSK
ncbi:MAG: hypothetical protein PHV95_10815 [Eubacteriales bacterium]|nr:hypothetical protein [Eubacteriales bacterium]